MIKKIVASAKVIIAFFNYFIYYLHTVKIRETRKVTIILFFLPKSVFLAE